MHLRYRPLSEYQKLRTKQKDEFQEWRESTGGGKKRGKPNNTDGKQQRRVKFKLYKAIAAAVEKKVNKQLKVKEQEEVQGKKAEAYIMSIFQKINASKATVAVAVNLPPAAAPSLPPTLYSIIQQ